MSRLHVAVLPHRYYNDVMAFLDRMVSDLIRSSTGFNARPFVRAVGGKNLLLLGGAAIAGALAAEKLTQGRPASQAAPPPPLPPPLPGQPQQAEAPPPLPVTPPPVPEVEGSGEEEIPKELLFAIVRTLVAGALADGEMQAEEKAVIENRLLESGLAPDQIQRIHKDMVIPPSPGELAALVATAEDRELLYRFGALVVDKDGGVSGHERTWLEKLASALELHAERCRELEREIFESA